MKPITDAKSFELIPLTRTTIGGMPAQTVNARDLHEYLQSGKDFSSWIKAQLDRARLSEGVDFMVESGSPKKVRKTGRGGNRLPVTEYHLTLDAAKHIAMMAETDRGTEVRIYFIRCEAELAKTTSMVSAATDLDAVRAAFADPVALRAALLSFAGEG